MEGDWIYEEQEDGSCSQEDIQICGLDGCPFRGPKSVLEDHILYLHATGVYNRLNRGNNDPKEIAAWREQRKKKYPTHSITESARLKSQSRKTQYELVNKARSEAFESFLLERTRLNEEKAKSRHNRTRDRQQQQKKQKRKKRVNGSGKENFMDDEEDPPGMNGSLHSFPGTAALTNSVQNESDEEEMDQKEMVEFHISDDEEDAMFRNKPIEPTDEVESETDSYDGPPEEICIVRGEKEDNFMSDETHKHSNNIERLIPNDNDLKNMARLQNYENRENPLNDEHSENIVECKPKNIDHLKDIERTSKNEALKNIYHTEDNEDKTEERKPNQHLNNTEHLKNDESSKNVEQCKPTTESPKKDLHIENIEHLPHFECSQNVGEDTENVQHPQTIEHTEDVQHSKIIEYTENVKNPKNRHNENSENSNDERIAQSSQHPNNVKQIKNYPKYPNNNEQLETIERHKSVDNPNEHPPNHELPDKDTDVISSHMEDTHPTTSNDDNSQNEGKSLPKSEKTSSTSPHKTTSKRQTDSNDDCPALKKLKTSKEENYTKSPYVIEPPQKSSIKLVRQSKEPISFLQILLSDEIKAEKKVLLQSVKYICDNNFFLDT